MTDETKTNEVEAKGLADESMEGVAGGVRAYFCVVDENGNTLLSSQRYHAAERYVAEHGGTIQQMFT